MKSGKQVLTARTADKFDLYQQSVQAELGVQLLVRRFQMLNGYPPRRFREDFCGTAFNCCQFVKLHPDNHAVGIDLDESALRWSLEHNFRQLSESQWKRIKLLKGNVLTIRTAKVDLIAALNLSYGIFRKRSDLIRYFSNAHTALGKNGWILIDALGGSAYLSGAMEQRSQNGFKFISRWSAMDPITHQLELAISYGFKDGSKLRNAFTYKFRIWSLPELQDILAEVGFRNIHVMWECIDKQNNTFFRKLMKARSYNHTAWYAILAAQR